LPGQRENYIDCSGQEEKDTWTVKLVGGMQLVNHRVESRSLRLKVIEIEDRLRLEVLIKLLKI